VLEGEESIREASTRESSGEEDRKEGEEGAPDFYRLIKDASNR